VSTAAPIFEVRLNQKKRKNCKIYLEGTQGMGFITAFHTLSKKGFKPSNELGDMSGGAVHMHDSEKARN
jgi:hypothetical protein